MTSPAAPTHPGLHRLGALLFVLVGAPLLLFLAQLLDGAGRSDAQLHADYRERGVRVEAVVTGFQPERWRDSRGRPRESLVVQVRFEHAGRPVDSAMASLVTPPPAQRAALLGQRVEIVHLPGRANSARWAPTVAALPDGMGLRMGALLLLLLAVLVVYLGLRQWRKAAALGRRPQTA